ncbi:hypothetical protein [Rarobacter faecitabidus]|uniref:hypothetical protein n=1 Tax=Rarobacter faecitabidus TaxID=13243 RepID=UPI00114E3EF3|nr:hypothetical protein [Rarobacter faecitabidus]
MAGPAYGSRQPGRGLRPATIAILAVAVLLSLVVAGVVVLQLMGAWGNSSAKAVAERFAGGYMAAETCDDSVLKIVNEDTTSSFRGGQQMTCADLSFVPNPDGFQLTVDEVAQGDTSATATLTMKGSSQPEQNGTYEIALVKSDGKWLVNSLRQTLADVNAV